MELWLWAVNGLMWLAAAGLTGVGIWKLSHGLKLLHHAAVEVSSHGEQKLVEQYTDIAKQHVKALRENMQRQQQSLLELKMELTATGQQLNGMEEFKRDLERLERKLKKQEKGLNQFEKDLEEQKGESNDISRIAHESNILARTIFAQIDQIWATSEIAQAAALFAIAGVLLGGSAVLITVFAT